MVGAGADPATPPPSPLSRAAVTWVHGSRRLPGTIGPTVTAVANARLGGLWVTEDYFGAGAIASAGAALAASRDLRVGIGVVSAFARHPAVLAMELSTLSALYPDRLIAGIGLGAERALQQMGLSPEAGVSAVEERVRGIRRLMCGEELSVEDGEFFSDGIALTHPPASPPDLWLGAIGPRMLRLGGAVATGVVLSVLASPVYVRWARSEIQRVVAPAAAPRRVATFALFAVDEDSDRARRRVRDALAFYLVSLRETALVETYGIRSDLARLSHRDRRALAGALPERWVRDLAVAGDPAECAEQIDRLVRAGSDEVALMPVGDDDRRSIELISEVLR